jgi:hypothetical protein
MRAYRAWLIKETDGQTLVEICFGEPADNDEIVPNTLADFSEFSLEDDLLAFSGGIGSFATHAPFAHLKW